jgi:hypothetical protein
VLSRRLYHALPGFPSIRFPGKIFDACFPDLWKTIGGKTEGPATIQPPQLRSIGTDKAPDSVLLLEVATTR